MRARLATAPVTWGVTEFPDWGPRLEYATVLDQMAACGYEGTELGPLGYLPTDPDRLAEELAARGLELVGAFVPLVLRDPAALPQEREKVRTTARLLQRLRAEVIILADAGDDERRRIAGRPEETARRGLTPEEWPGYAARLEELARLAREEFGLLASFHSHGGTYIENPSEIEALLERTSADLIGFCLDTGHVAFGGGDPVALARRYRSRLNHLHLKDIDLTRLGRLLSQGAGYLDAARGDVFVALGRGQLDLDALMEVLAGYQGWVVVEQDRVVRPGTDPSQSARESLEFLRARLRVEPPDGGSPPGSRPGSGPGSPRPTGR